MPVRVIVSVPDQSLRLLSGNNRVIREYPVSTGAHGTGTAENSNRTPLGRFRIARKIGDGAEPGTIFRSRRVTGIWRGEESDEDYVLTRILWLDGCDPENANTFRRYIYIHGTNQEHLIGTPASHGCVRMRNGDVIDLYDRVAEGTPVRIVNRPFSALRRSRAAGRPGATRGRKN